MENILQPCSSHFWIGNDVLSTVEGSLKGFQIVCACKEHDQQIQCPQHLAHRLSGNMALLKKRLNGKSLMSEQTIRSVRRGYDISNCDS